MSASTISQASLSQLSLGQALPDSRPVATYERRSKRRAGGKVSNDGVGQNLSEDNQHAENVAYAQRVCPQSEVIDFRDNASAWDPDAKRPNWKAMLKAIESGQVQAVIAWHADRFTRQPMQLEMLIAACEKGRAELYTAMGGHHADPTMVRIESALSWKESKVKSDRQKLHHHGLAEAGKYHGGPRRYGYEPGMTSLRESEAYWVRWMAQGVLAGRSLMSLEKEMTARGVLTASGKAWRSSNMGTYLRSPFIAGLREHQGAVIGAADWPGILEVDTWRAVKLLLENPERRTSQSQARVHLLTTIAKCGVCGGGMQGRKNGTRCASPSYTCANRCVSRRADATDQRVIQEVLARLTQLSPSGILNAPSVPEPDSRLAIEAELAQLDANLTTLGAQVVMGEIPAEVMQGASKAAGARKAELQAQLSDLALEDTQPAAVLAGVAGRRDVVQVWAGLDLERRRAIVDLLCSVTVLKATRKGAPFDPELIQVAWK